MIISGPYRAVKWRSPGSIVVTAEHVIPAQMVVPFHSPPPLCPQLPSLALSARQFNIDILGKMHSLVPIPLAAGG